MSTPEQPDAPALTRKQLREIRNTGATPIVSGDQATPVDEPQVDESQVDEPQVDGTPVDEPSADEPHGDEPNGEAPPDGDMPVRGPESSSIETADETPAPVPAAPAAPLPRAALPPAVGDAPAADASVDLGVAPLTRRQARQQERIRTASVPVITPDVAAAHAQATTLAEPAPPTPAVPANADASAQSAPVIIDTVPEAEVDDVIEATLVETTGEQILQQRDDRIADEERAVVSPQLGADLLAGEPIEVALPPSFDQLISRSVTGAITTGNALILSQTPSAPPLSSPVTATGEVLITGTFNLPEGLGSMGHAAGTTDGKDVDAVLVDGELPAHSSPTPIAASAAISTMGKTPGDVITPPTPEKGGRLMLTLAITAGVLALALVGVLILAFVTGVF